MFETTVNEFKKPSFWCSATLILLGCSSVLNATSTMHCSIDNQYRFFSDNVLEKYAGSSTIFFDVPFSVSVVFSLYM